MKALKENLSGIIVCLLELVIGLLLLINPVGFTSGIIITLGILLCLNGLSNCIKYFRADVKEASKGQFLTKGLIAVLAGAFCVFNTDWFIVTFSALTVIYGVIVLLASIQKIQLCVDLLRKKRKKWYLAAISAVISLVCAVIILKNPFSSTTLIWIVAGISLILEAIFDMYTLMENCRKQEEKVKSKEVQNKTEEESTSKMRTDEMNADSENATVVNVSDETNSDDVTLESTESEEETDGVSAKKNWWQKQKEGEN